MKNKNAFYVMVMMVSSLTLTSCSSKNFDSPNLQGLAILWYPVIWFWWMIFCWFAPNYLGFMSNIWSSGIPWGDC